MIPIRDTVRSTTFPLVNTLIIAVNVLVYLWSLGPDQMEVFLRYGIVPVRYSVPQLAAGFSLAAQALPFISSMFLHGGLLHLLGNIWFLYIFGDNVEDRLGPVRYLAFYLLCGVSSGLTHLFLNWDSQLPTIGASGAIAGVMGAYFILYPRARVLTLIPIFLFFPLVEIPAFIFLGIWLLIQFLNASLAPAAETGGVAWWAHFGGFVFGMLFLLVFTRLPVLGLQKRITRPLKRRSSPRISKLTPRYYGSGRDAQAALRITGSEARNGAAKTVVVASGFRQRRVKVRVPPGVKDGTVLRLKGLGRPAPDGPGDLYLTLAVG
jgi:membrane associated rhomboid family serine protease